MQKRLLDILADPDNPNNWPLKLEIFKSEFKERNSFPKPHSTTGRLCKFYCYFKDQFLVENPLQNDEKVLPKHKIDKIVTFDECKICMREEIIDGIVYHDNDSERKWFIIDQEIPVMFPLNLRDSRQEQDFIDRYPIKTKEFGITKPFKIREN